MTLGELIETLTAEDPNAVVRLGFSSPHSYRGVYAELAFEPSENVTIGSMLDAAKEALGNTYCGYKGGDFTMGKWTPVHLANYGDCGEEIGPHFLRLMLANRADVKHG